MAEQHLCRRHGRPGIASRVRLDRLSRRLRAQRVEVEIAEDAVRRLVENELSRMLLDGSVEPGDKVAVDVAGDMLRFEVKEGAATELLREWKEESTSQPTGSPA